mgnify:CR=1 FL=1
MNYYQALELQRDGKGCGLWHYTVTNDDMTRPVGYCSKQNPQWIVCQLCEDKENKSRCPMCGGAGGKAFECPGHPSANEACAHYRAYLLDTAVYGSKWDKPTECQFPGCGGFTNNSADVGPGRMQIFMLCQIHCNRAGLERVLPDVGESASSY